MRNVLCNFPTEFSAFENLSVIRNVPSNSPLDWTPFIKEHKKCCEKKMVHWFSFHSGKNKKKGSSLEDIPFFRKYPVKNPVLFGFSGKNQFFLTTLEDAPKKKKTGILSAQATTTLKIDALFTFLISRLFITDSEVHWSASARARAQCRIRVIEVIISVSCDHMSCS